MLVQSQHYHVGIAALRRSMAVPQRLSLWRGFCLFASARPFSRASENVTFSGIVKGATPAWIAVTAALLCASSPVASSAATRELTRDSTIQELMTTRIDPAADALWASVSTIITAAGVQETQPRTEAEWRTVRRYAVTLIEGANLLAVSRRVAVPGGTTEDSATPGIERSENIQKAIEIDRRSFVRAAVQLRDAGIVALRAIDRRDQQRLIEAGGDLDAACEACHLKYWYPHSPRPPASDGAAPRGVRSSAIGIGGADPGEVDESCAVSGLESLKHQLK
jgi:hypothetical protein